jgi:hypothetical protein
MCCVEAFLEQRIDKWIPCSELGYFQTLSSAKGIGLTFRVYADFDWGRLYRCTFQGWFSFLPPSGRRTQHRP